MFNSEPKIVVVILNWNGRADTLDCLDSVSCIDYLNYEVVVVDNGSSDNSVEAIRQQYPAISILETGCNLGYAGGNNVGIREALRRGAEFVLLLNNDTTVDPGVLVNLMAAAKAVPSSGMFGPKIYFASEPRKIWYAGGIWDNNLSRLVHVGEGQKDDGESFNRITETEFITGCALLVKKEVVESIGVMDERFFLVFEESDWCYRARRYGYRCVFVPGALVWHKIAASFDGEESPLRTYFSFRNRLLWAERNLSLSRQFFVHMVVYKGIGDRFVGSILRNLNGRQLSLRGLYWGFIGAFKSPQNKAWLWALYDYWSRRFGDCPERIRLLNQIWSRFKKHQAYTESS